MKNPILLLAEKWRGWSKVQRGLAVVLAAGLCLVAAGNRPFDSAARHQTVPVYPPVAEFVEPGPEQGAAVDENDGRQFSRKGAPGSEAVDKDDRREAKKAASSSPDDPRIAHRAELAVLTREFSRSRTSLQEILERHRAYAARLRMIGQKSGSVLNATLRVPAAELTDTVSELKSLGDVEREEQAADEITEQRAELEARLGNARQTLKRLEELLAKQNYPDGNVRELERQIAAARADAARLEAERQASEHRVIFANVLFTLREEVAKPSESMGAQLRLAAAGGFAEAMASLAGLLAFLVGRGPLLLLWCAILWVPARLVWKKWAAVAAGPRAVVSGN